MARRARAGAHARGPVGPGRPGGGGGDAHRLLRRLPRHVDGADPAGGHHLRASDHAGLARAGPGRAVGGGAGHSPRCQGRLEGETDGVHGDAARGRVHPRRRGAPRFARVVRTNLLPPGVRGSRAGRRPGPGQPVVQPPQGHASRHALSVSARGRDQAGALHPRRHPRRDRGPAARVADVSPAHVGRADRRQPPQLLRAGPVRPRLSGAGGRAPRWRT